MKKTHIQKTRRSREGYGVRMATERPTTFPEAGGVPNNSEVDFPPQRGPEPPASAPPAGSPGPRGSASSPPRSGPSSSSPSPARGRRTFGPNRVQHPGPHHPSFFPPDPALLPIRFPHHHPLPCRHHCRSRFSDEITASAPPVRE